MLTFFAPRSHEWNFLAVVSVIMGLLISGAELRSGSQHVDIGRGALVVLLYVGLETAGIFLGYALLKKFLGLIRSL